MSRILEAALEQAVEDALDVEDVAVEALQEAATWRQLAVVALAMVHDANLRVAAMERRMRAAETTIHQVMGTKPWHEEQFA